MATPTLRLTVGNSSVIIEDNGVGDSSTESGVVSYLGGASALGGFGITIGISKRNANSLAEPLLTLNEVTVIGGTGTLVIEFSEVGFGPMPASRLFASIGGTTNAKVSYSVYADPSNELFGITPENLVTSQGAFTGSASNAYSFGGSQNGGDANGLLPADGPFSLTQRVVIERGTTPDNTGFNARVSAVAVPDGGATVALLGFSMVGLAGLMKVFGGRRSRDPRKDA